jgi:hypothetical protein
MANPKKHWPIEPWGDLLGAMNQPERARADLVWSFELYQEQLTKQKATLGPEDPQTLETMGHLVFAGAKTGNFDRVQSLFFELMAQIKKMDEQRVHDGLAEFGKTLLDIQEYAEAELTLRQCLAIREKMIPEDWRRYNAVSMLGGALLGQKKYAEAEPLLLQGYEGMKKRESQIPLSGSTRLPEAAERLVQLYDAWVKPGQAAQWREKLDEEKKKSAPKLPASKEGKKDTPQSAQRAQSKE